MLMATDTKFWTESDDARILWQCTAGKGPQNDVMPVGDGTYLAADGGSSSPVLAARSAGLYVYDPASRRVLWRLPAASPMTVEFGPVGTLVTAQGSAGVNWLAAKDGSAVRSVKLPAPCVAAVVLSDGDVLAAAGTCVYRVDPAGTVLASFDLGGAVTSLAARGPSDLLATVTGKGLLRLSTVPDGPATLTVVVKVEQGASRVTANR